MENGKITENLTVVIGKKQIMRLAKENALSAIQIATDADSAYAQAIENVAKQHKIEVIFRGTMQEIARQHGIEVPSGAVGFVKNNP